MLGEIETLHSAFKLAIDRIIVDMRAKGWDPVIGSGMRSIEQQDALYAQGRKPLTDVNALRRAAGMPSISAKANKGTVTKAKGGESNHNRRQYLAPYGGNAFDIAVGYAVDIVDRKRQWEADPGFWKDLGPLAEKYGCEWGGRWKKPDVAHVQMLLIDMPPRTSIVV